MPLRTKCAGGKIVALGLAWGVRLVVAGVAALMGLGILSGCNSFFSSSSNATHLAFVAGGVNAVSAYRINNRSGNVSTLVGSPFVAGKSPSSVVVHPSNQFLYVANQADSTISRFNINSTTGALTEVLPRTSVAGMISPAFLTMDGSGNSLFVANQGSNDVWMFQIGTAGALTQVSGAPVASVGSSPAGLVFTAGFLFVPVPNFSAIAVVNITSGAMQFVGVGNGVSGIALNPGGNFLYATNPSTNTVSVFSVAGGTLTAMPNLTVATGTTPVAAALDMTGGFLYVANSGSATVSQFKIDSTTGALTAFTTASVSVGTNPGFVVVDPGGKFIFVGNIGASSVTELSIASDGSLTSSNTISPGFVPRSLALTK